MNLISQVMDLYARLDRQVAEFQQTTGLHCPFGCGRCCPTATVDATVLEMLPAAAEMLRQGTHDQWLARIAEAEADIGCVLYETDRPETAPGHCGFYPWRAVVCRLFGFAAVRTRDGHQTLAACKHLKAADPNAVAHAVELSAEAPCFSDIGAILFALDPGLGGRLMPINAALAEAIHRLGLYRQMTTAPPDNLSSRYAPPTPI